ncbi:hypothetical protein BS17DRAFT_522428 [Gyrodon lividus]|nr:hypothetical protein BS17DRAFT_522428 [Gyrodon lividus]
MLNYVERRVVLQVPVEKIPIAPISVKRYDKFCQITDRKPKRAVNAQAKDMIWSPNSINSSMSQSKHPDGWISCTHPEGALYYFNSQKRVFTEADVTNKKIAAKVNQCARELCDEAGPLFTAHVELTVELIKSKERYVCGYYFTCHDRRLLFWLRGVDIRNEGHVSAMLHDLKVITKTSQLKYAMESQYWSHCVLYPNHRRLPQRVLHEVKQTVLYFNAGSCSYTRARSCPRLKIDTEMVLSDVSLTPFDRDQLNVFLTVVDGMKDSVDRMDAHSVNFCGEPEARLNADQSMVKSRTKQKCETLKRRLWNSLRSCFVLALWNSPKAHLRALERVWVDRTFIEPRWKGFLTQLNTEWTQITVLVGLSLSVIGVPMFHV